MNPLTNMKNVIKLSERELEKNSSTSWHDQYKGSAWIFVGGFPYDLSEGDIICVFSQYGEIVNINLIRDKKTGKQKGFCFICYEDQRSTILAVDNLNGIKILGKSLRVDHVQDYKVPKDSDKIDLDTRQLYAEGCAPKAQIPENRIKVEPGTPPLRQDLNSGELPFRLPIGKRSPKREHKTEPKRIKTENKPEREQHSRKTRIRRSFD